MLTSSLLEAFDSFQLLLYPKNKHILQTPEIQKSLHFVDARMMHGEINGMSKDTWEAFPRIPHHPVTEIKWLLKNTK